MNRTILFLFDPMVLKRIRQTTPLMYCDIWYDIVEYDIILHWILWYDIVENDIVYCIMWYDIVSCNTFFLKKYMLMYYKTQNCLTLVIYITKSVF